MLRAYEIMKATKKNKYFLKQFTSANLFDIKDDDESSPAKKIHLMPSIQTLL